MCEKIQILRECLISLSSFCHSCIEPRFSRRVEITHKWLHFLLFEVLSSGKGMYFDGHEREDVVKE